MNTNVWFYKLAAVAGITLSAIILVQLATFMIAPPPYTGTAAEWFALFQHSPILGLINFELLMVVYTLISLLLAAALYSILKRTQPTWMAIYLGLNLIGAAAFVSARPVLEMYALSREFSTAAVAQKPILLAAGEMLLARFNGPVFHTSYLLGSLTGVILSAVMLKSRLFGRAAVYLRLASSVCDLGLYLPGIGIYISIFSVLFLFIWNLLIARRLLQFALDSAQQPSLRHPTQPQRSTSG